MKLRYILPVVMTAVYLSLALSAPAQYYVGYESLRGTYILIGTPPVAHQVAFAINAPATALLTPVLRFRGKLTGREELWCAGVFVPVLWFLVGVFLEQTMRARPRSLVLGAAGVFLATVIAVAILEPKRVVVVWIAFGLWVLVERALRRRASVAAGGMT